MSPSHEVYYASTGTVTNVKIASSRPLACAVCEAPVNIESATSPHPEAPEMLRPPPGAWLGFVQGDTCLEFVVACSEGCLDILLKE
jgi:hypothetical protein